MVSDDNVNWTLAYSEQAGDGGVDNLAVTATGQYVRLLGLERGIGYGFSLFSFDVYGALKPVVVVPEGDLALGKPTSASSSEWAEPTAANATDGNTGTRWASAWTDSEWISVDMGEVYPVGRVVLNWEGAYGKGYNIQTSNNGADWTTVYTETAGDGGTDEIILPFASGRYIRVLGTERGTGYGYSLWDLEIYAD